MKRLVTALYGHGLIPAPVVEAVFRRLRLGRH